MSIPSNLKFQKPAPEPPLPPENLSRRVANAEPTPASSSVVIASIRDLIVHLHRGNGAKAESILTDVAGRLQVMLGSGEDPGSSVMQRAQQTMFAIDEVRILLAQRDFEGAAAAARDAGREWKQPGAARE
jgi:hypothetical protein